MIACLVANNLVVVVNSLAVAIVQAKIESVASIAAVEVILIVESLVLVVDTLTENSLKVMDPVSLLPVMILAGLQPEY